MLQQAWPVRRERRLILGRRPEWTIVRTSGVAVAGRRNWAREAFGVCPCLGGDLLVDLDGVRQAVGRFQGARIIGERLRVLIPYRGVRADIRIPSRRDGSVGSLGYWNRPAVWLLNWLLDGLRLRLAGYPFSETWNFAGCGRLAVLLGHPFAETGGIRHITEFDKGEPGWATPPASKAVEPRIDQGCRSQNLDRRSLV